MKDRSNILVISFSFKFVLFLTKWAEEFFSFFKLRRTEIVKDLPKITQLKMIWSTGQKDFKHAYWFVIVNPVRHFAQNQVLGR